ncbi:MAG TPA: hydroxymethylglutaryl-CoA lyase [Bacteroidia bacterium]|nr:hydroxymethylglutaryl-CoA lyase [Bacteroidia bacterium]HQW49320.1 hydroxymethylglutaryl-CoA lyase [Bacteroidia bacterium]HRA58754.1 hydroxymethylglutaryl-CoA lyase [Bacteroidia bacterium]HRB53510.1 hydroxymethylglutaryl-CoA lyase [Bacteroidia bacterium]HRC15037.1 hydroxymethylglutaryl-CoA lyase [Bacteroidia bacterium]
MPEKLKIIECPRDAMQGMHDFVPTDLKIEYINKLLEVGFDTIDFGSFVSSKAIPQMRDTAEVLAGLNKSTTKLLAIIANVRGAEDAVKHQAITYLGYPFSISETFQKRNTNATIQESLANLNTIQQLTQNAGKKLVVYISMGFGNPYGEEWNVDYAAGWIDKIQSMGVEIISLADTVGVAKEADISYLFEGVIQKFPKVEFGAHLHTTPGNWQNKLAAAYDAGCRRFDTAIRGFGGCPMATDKLTGNLATENAVQYLSGKLKNLTIDIQKLNDCILFSNRIFNEH